MKVLLIGNGAREHAIAERLAQDCELYALMSKKNPAISQLSKAHWICDIEDAEAVKKAIAGKEFDLGFSSPDATLAAGVSDALAAAGMLIASPSKAASRIEWDKGFMRTILKRHGVKGSPLHEVVTSSSDALRVIKDYGDVAVKPLGLTGGKGVKVSGDHFTNPEEAADYAYSLIEKDGSVLIEEKIIGEEFTLQAFCDGSRVSVMPPVQDHKRAFEGDSGPNTGGMGSYSAGQLLPFLRQSDIEDAKKILQDVVRAMKKEGSPFTGVLYGQFMATAHGIRVVEFNARFGDPEAMNVLSLLNGSLTDTFLSMAEGQLDAPVFSDECTVVKYLVPEGYPVQPLKDAEVIVDSIGLEDCNAKIYYASVYETGGKIMTTSSRAFGILGKAATLADAERIAEKGCGFVHGPVWHRSDIGTAALIQRRIDRMRSLRVKT
ncbi:MAG: phosphoribosylamine--glycine ligase [Candidatus ainarchaeum sp.]|nr:phosphoribosylamine--glycine ligase [Candidatus ainarchaeum sp.]